MLPNTIPLSPVLAIPATQSPAHKQTIAVLKTVSLLTDRNKHTSFNVDETGTHKHKKEKSTLSSFFPFRRHMLSFTLRLSLCARMKITPVSGVCHLCIASRWGQILDCLCRSDLTGDGGGGHGNWLLTRTVGGNLLQINMWGKVDTWRAHTSR